MEKGESLSFLPYLIISCAPILGTPLRDITKHSQPGAFGFFTAQGMHKREEFDVGNDNISYWVRVRSSIIIPLSANIFFFTNDDMWPSTLCSFVDFRAMSLNLHFTSCFPRLITDSRALSLCLNLSTLAFRLILA